MPPALRGLGITFIITGLMAIGFMSFGGMLTGGDEEAKEVKTAVIESNPSEDEIKMAKQVKKTKSIADNNIKVIK